jgi:hypothetical protein
LGQWLSLSALSKGQYAHFLGIVLRPTALPTRERPNTREEKGYGVEENQGPHYRAEKEPPGTVAEQRGMPLDGECHLQR